jgi:hypothetical protein
MSRNRRRAAGVAGAANERNRRSALAKELARSWLVSRDADDETGWTTRMELELNNFWRQTHPTKADDLSLRMLKWALVNTMKLTQVNLAGQQGFGPSVERRHIPVWSKLYELFFVYFTLKWFACTVMEYKYSQLVQTIRTMNRTLELNYLSADLDQRPIRETRQQLNAELAQMTELLDFVGSPWREIGSAVPVAYFGVLMMVCAVYLGPRLFVYFKGPIRGDFFRVLLKPELERINIHKDICGHVDGFLKSSGNYFRFYFRMGFELSGLFFASFDTDDGRRSSYGQKPDTPATADKHTLDELAGKTIELVLANRLEPFNRRQEWVNTMRRVAAFMGLALELVVGFLVVVSSLVFPFYVIGFERLHLGPNDLWLACEIVVYISAALQVASFYFLVLVSAAIDQNKYASELIKMINAAIVEINQRLMSGGAHDDSDAGSQGVVDKCRREWAPPPPPDDRRRRRRTRTNNISYKDDPIRRVHVRLIVILIQFRMFKDQLGATKQVKGFGIGCVQAMMPIFPLMGCFVPGPIDPRTKLILMLDSVGIIIMANWIVLPSCHLHARCIDIYHGLAKLHAHLVAATHFRDAQIRANWLESGLGHSQTLLRAEFKMPDVMLDKLTTRTLLGRVTYERFIGVLFWCGLLLIMVWFRGTTTVSFNMLLFM